jgi:hypothetical protein
VVATHTEAGITAATGCNDRWTGDCAAFLWRWYPVRPHTLPSSILNVFTLTILFRPFRASPGTKLMDWDVVARILNNMLSIQQPSLQKHPNRSIPNPRLSHRNAKIGPESIQQPRVREHYDSTCSKGCVFLALR